MEMCRVCLSPEKEMLPLDENFVNNYNFLTNLNITLLDGMPQTRCQTCSDTVKYFIDFREKCIASESRLREIVIETVKTENIEENLHVVDDSKNEEIKIECKQEYDESNLLLEGFNVSYDYFDEQSMELIISNHENDVPVDKRKRDRTKSIKIKKEKTTNKTKEKTIKNDKTFHRKKKICCGLCPNTFDDNEMLNSHLDTHRSEKKCGLCTDAFSSWSQFLAHRLVHVPVGHRKCHLCNRSFKSPVYLEHHLKNVHIHDEGKKMTCKVCNHTFGNPKRLLRHMTEMHTTVKFVCDVCSKGFCNKTYLRSHLKKHSNNKMFVCDMCGFSCKYSHGLKDHKLRKHVPDKMYCKNCTRPFLTLDDFERHQCAEKVTVCPICGKLFNSRRRLTRHLHSHNDNLKFECKRCPAKYKTRAALVAHTDRHDDNRTQECDICHAKFFTRGVLFKHLRVHTGEKPYVCKVCNKGFTSNNNLKVHMKVHGQYLIVKKNSEKDDPTIETK